MIVIIDTSIIPNTYLWGWEEWCKVICYGSYNYFDKREGGGTLPPWLVPYIGTPLISVIISHV